MHDPINIRDYGRQPEPKQPRRKPGKVSIGYRPGTEVVPPGFWAPFFEVWVEYRQRHILGDYPQDKKHYHAD